MIIPLDRPEGGTSLDDETYTYSPNDITPADVDGDDEYELVFKGCRPIRLTAEKTHVITETYI